MESLGTVTTLPRVDASTLMMEDAEQQLMAVPFRFGHAVDVNYTVGNSGRWYQKPEGRVWKLNIRSEGAYSINLIFDQLVLPMGAELYIYNETRTMVYGPLTSEITNETIKFGTDLIQGELITLELFEPNGSKDATLLKIGKAVHAYRDMFGMAISDNHENTRSTCDHNNVICNGFSNWQSRSNSVAMVLLADGTRVCSGSLLNNTCQDFTPNFLTAFHCIDTGDIMHPCELEYGNGQLNQNEINRAQNWVFRFQYKSPTCDPTSAPNSWVSYNGSTYRAGWAQTDFALVEMNTRPTAETGIQYAGWSRSNVAPTSGATIHHPQGNPMKISTYATPAVHSAEIPWFIGIQGVCERFIPTPANSHWTATLSNGTTEDGSSGGPLYDQNRRVIGQLHGGVPGCAPIERHFGKLSQSWGADAFGAFLAGRNATNSLRPWLAPVAAINTTTDLVTIPSITGPDRVCTTAMTYTLQNIPPLMTTSWTATPSHLFPSGQNSGTGNSASIRAAHGSVSGSATITFTYTKGSGCGTFQLSKQIWVGVPGALTSILPNYQPICTGEYTYFNAYYNMFNPNQPGNGEADITNYVWTPPSGASCFTAGNKNEVLACWFQTGAGFGMNQTVAVRAVNSCGQGAMSYANFSVSDCFYFSVGINPNPASNRVTIELTETPLDAEAKAVLGAENKGAREYQEYSFNSPPHRIRVFDILGAERLCVENVPEGHRHELDISHLTPGVYVVHLEHRNGTVVRQLRVD